MSLKYVLISGFAAALLSTTASAQPDDTYVCNDRLCYDDQAEATRQLNLQQLENGGYVSGDDSYDDTQDDMQGQGGPYYESEDDANQGAYDPDDSYDNGPPPSDDGAYSDDDDDDMGPPADDYDDEDE